MRIITWNVVSPYHSAATDERSTDIGFVTVKHDRMRSERSYRIIRESQADADDNRSICELNRIGRTDGQSSRTSRSGGCWMPWTQRLSVFKVSRRRFTFPPLLLRPITAYL